MKRNVYVLIDGDRTESYSNLTKLIKDTPKLTYYTIYRALILSNRVDKNGCSVIKTILK
jgi:hypothetical protein